MTLFNDLFQQKKQNGEEILSVGKITFIFSIIMAIITTGVIASKYKPLGRNIRRASNKYLISLIGLIVPIASFAAVYYLNPDSQFKSYYLVAGLTLITACIIFLSVFLLISEGKDLIGDITICPASDDGTCCNGTLAEFQTCVSNSRDMCDNNPNMAGTCECSNGQSPNYNCFDPTGLFADKDEMVKLTSEKQNYITYYHAHDMTTDKRQDYILSLPLSQTYPGQLWKRINLTGGSFLLKNMLFEDKYLYNDDKSVNFILDNEKASVFVVDSKGIVSLQTNKKQLSLDSNGELTVANSQSFITLEKCPSGSSSCAKK